jgi:YD repeat-containing protein
VWQPAVADAENGGTVERPHWHYDYDGLGNLTSITDPRHSVTSFAYDAHGRRTSRTLPAVSGNTVTESVTRHISISIHWSANLSRRSSRNSSAAALSRVPRSSPAYG